MNSQKLGAHIQSSQVIALNRVIYHKCGKTFNCISLFAHKFFVLHFWYAHITVDMDVLKGILYEFLKSKILTVFWHSKISIVF